MHFQWLQHSRGGGGQQQVKPEPATGDVVMEALPSHAQVEDDVDDKDKGDDDSHIFATPSKGWLSFSDGAGY